MRLERRNLRGVLRDKSGISASMPEALAGIGLKAVIITIVGGVVAAGVAFLAVTTATADASAGYQNANVAFEKAVHSSDIVVGLETDRVGLLRNVAGDKCEIEAWQSGTSDGKKTLVVDRTTVAGECSVTTPLPAAGSTTAGMTLLSDIAAPLFEYTNRGGRTITFNASAAPTLATAAKPADVKQSDFDDVRPYKVTLTLKALDKDNSAATKEAVATGYTNVLNLTPTPDEVRYVPNPDDNVPGPIIIASIERSTTTGTVYSGAREGAAVTFTGGVCESGPTTVDVSYERQSPGSAPRVNTIYAAELTEAATTVHLGSVPNGSTGAVEVAASCVKDGAVVKDALVYTQAVPAPQVTAKLNASTYGAHDVSWTKVSSLPTSFEVFRDYGKLSELPQSADKLATTTDKLVYLSDTKGLGIGRETTYVVVATVDTVRSEPGSTTITTPLEAPSAPVVTTSQAGATWTAVECPAYTTAQYAERHYQQTGTDTTVTWSAYTAWSTSTKVTLKTPEYGRTVYSVVARCAATASGAISPNSPASAVRSFYMPETPKVTVTRSTTSGTAFSGAREGALVSYTGARCWNGTSSKVSTSWSGTSPSNQADVTASAAAAPVPASGGQLNMAGIANGATGNVTTTVTCTAGVSGSISSAVQYKQPVPAPTVSATLHATVGAHVVSWTKVSSLPTTFEVYRDFGSVTKVAQTAANLAGTTDKLTLTYNTKGLGIGQKTTYDVVAIVNSVRSQPGSTNITTPLAAPGTPTVTPTTGGATWTAVTCPAYTTAEYSERHYQQTGTVTTVSWSAWSEWSTSRKATVTTPGYGRTVYTVIARCVANESGAVSANSPASPQVAFYMPETPKVTVARSTVSGTAYSGAREGALVSYTGARCWNGGPSIVTTTWTGTSPTNQPSRTATTPAATVPASGGSFNIAGIANGASGTFRTVATCEAGVSGTAASANSYNQPVPKPVLEVGMSFTADRHQLDWTAVSSLPTSFDTNKSAQSGRENENTTALSTLTRILSYTPGTSYGNTHTYSITATVNGKTATSDKKTYVADWPRVPKAQSIAWTQGTGNTGTLKWSYDWSCPAGTTLKGQQHENRTGQSNGTFSNTVRASSAWATEPTSYAWKASYALNGYAYAMGVDSKCLSDVTGFESTTQKVQSPTFVMPMVKPAKPVWDAYNYRDWVRGTNWTYSTCFAGGCPSMTIDYKTYCSAGSVVGWSNFSSTDWNPMTYNHAFGWQDNWHLTPPLVRNVTYHNAKYSCSTPWRTSPQSDPGNNVIVQVRQP